MSNSNLAVPELAAIEVHGISRSAFLMRATIAAGSVYGLGAVSPLVRQAFAQTGQDDAAILNFALTLEYLEATFYERALKQVKGLRADAKEVAEQIAKDEAQHVQGLTTAIKNLGEDPVKAPKVDFGGAFANERSFLKLAQTFEDTGVSAYNGAAPGIKSKAILGTAGAIVQVEARHAGIIRFLRGEDITPAAADPSLEKQEVLNAVAPFVKS